jgi:hypothetical protein
MRMADIFEEDLILECQLCHKRFSLPRVWDGDYGSKLPLKHLFDDVYCGGHILPLVFIR